MSDKPGSIDNLSGSSQNSAAVCDLCGLSLHHARIDATFAGKRYAFCCNGCRQVFSILLEASDESDPATFKHTELFKQCREMGIIPKSEAELARDQPNLEADDPAGPVPVYIEV